MGIHPQFSSPFSLEDDFSINPLLNLENDFENDNTVGEFPNYYSMYDTSAFSDDRSTGISIYIQGG